MISKMMSKKELQSKISDGNPGTPFADTLKWSTKEIKQDSIKKTQQSNEINILYRFLYF